MPGQKSAAQSVYTVHPSVAYARAIVDNLPKTTGRSIDDWIKLVRAQALETEKEQREWLKQRFKLGGTTTWMIASYANGTGGQDTDPEAYLQNAPIYVETMYASKPALRPIHHALVELGRSLGEDVKICPCQTMVPLYRKHVFAEIKPSTKTRIDFGLALKGSKRKPPKRIIDTGGEKKNDRITHRIPITSLDDIDEEVRTWLKIAYDLDVEK